MANDGIKGNCVVHMQIRFSKKRTYLKWHIYIVFQNVMFRTEIGKEQKLNVLFILFYKGIYYELCRLTEIFSSEFIVINERYQHRLKIHIHNICRKEIYTFCSFYYAQSAFSWTLFIVLHKSKCNVLFILTINEFF